MDNAQEHGMWRAIGECEGSLDEFDRRINGLERRLVAVAIACLVAGALMGAVLAQVRVERAEQQEARYHKAI